MKTAKDIILASASFIHEKWLPNRPTSRSDIVRVFTEIASPQINNAPLAGEEAIQKLDEALSGYPQDFSISADAAEKLLREISAGL